jgi:hypothetical protein
MSSSTMRGTFSLPTALIRQASSNADILVLESSAFKFTPLSSRMVTALKQLDFTEV